MNDQIKEYLLYGYTNNTEYKHLEEIKPLTTNTFKNPHKDSVYTKLVIVGTYIDDKLSISKEKLYQVFCGGVIALKHKYESVNIKNNELENKVTILETELEIEKTKVSTLETELEIEKTKVSTLETQLQDILTRLSILENN